VDNDVGAEIQRTLKVGREKSVVDHNDQLRIVLVRSGGQSGDVADFERGIGRGFQPKQLGILFQRRHHSADIGGIDKVHAEALRHGDAAKEAIGAAVHVIACHNVVRWREQVHNCRQCRAA
jgi:hypothetical protein